MYIMSDEDKLEDVQDDLAEKSVKKRRLEMGDAYTPMPAQHPGAPRRFAKYAHFNRVFRGNAGRATKDEKVKAIPHAECFTKWVKERDACGKDGFRGYVAKPMFEKGVNENVPYEPAL
jgi:hypothetical protein